MSRPARLVVVLGTGTEVGKTWVACRLLERLRAGGAQVAARKPAQSFEATDLAAGVPTDADLLAAASGESAHEVCPSHRSYPVALAPPMAADRLGQPEVHLHDLLAEIAWPEGVDVGLVEAAGGVRSPLAHDGDGVDLVRHLAPDHVVLVADAGLGTLHSIRSSLEHPLGVPVTVMLNRFDPDDHLHAANHDWLVDRDRFAEVTDVEALAAAVRS